MYVFIYFDVFDQGRI